MAMPAWPRHLKCVISLARSTPRINVSLIFSGGDTGVHGVEGVPKPSVNDNVMISLPQLPKYVLIVPEAGLATSAPRDQHEPSDRKSSQRDSPQ